MHRLTLSNMCYPNTALSAPRSNTPGLPSCRPLPILSPAGPLQIRAHPEHSRCWWDALADRPLPSPRPPCTWPAGQPAVRGPHTAAGMVSRTMPASHRLPRAQMRVSGTAETGRGAAGAARRAPGGYATRGSVAWLPGMRARAQAIVFAVGLGSPMGREGFGVLGPTPRRSCDLISARSALSCDADGGGTVRHPLLGRSVIAPPRFTSFPSLLLAPLQERAPPASTSSLGTGSSGASSTS